MQVKCYECDTEFQLTSMFPSCPECGSEDIDLPEED